MTTARSAFLLLLLAWPLAAVAQVHFYPVGPAPRSVSTSAEVTIAVPAHRVSLVVAVCEKAPTAAEAGAQHAAAMSRLTEAFRSLGFDDESLPASSYSIARDENWDTGELLGYEASSEISIELGNPNDLGAAVDTLLSAGASQISRIKFLAENPEATRDEALKQAFVAAKKEANDLAIWSNSQLGEVLNVSTGSQGYRKLSTGTSVTKRTTSTVIPVPQVKISASVSVRWALLATGDGQ